MENKDIAALYRRAELFLEDKDWDSARKYYENILDTAPEDSHAYIGLLLASLQISHEEELLSCRVLFTENKDFEKALRFSTDEYNATLNKYATANKYNYAIFLLQNAKTESDYRKALLELNKFSDSEGIPNIIDACSKNIDNLVRIKSAKLKKAKITTIAVIALIVTLVAIVIGTKTSENKKRAEIIYNNFLGQSFSGHIEDDDNFVSDYNNYSLNQYKTYWKTTESRSLKFNNDGTVYYTYSSDREALAYPKMLGEPDDYHYDYDGTLSSFNVYIKLDGTVYVDVGIYDCVVSVDSNNVPQTIYDYDGINLR